MFNSNNKQIATSILSLGKFYRIVYTVNSMTTGGECSSVDHSSLLIPYDVEPSNADVRYWGDALRRAEVTAESVGDFMASHCGFVLNAKAEYSIHDVLPDGQFKLKASSGSVALTLNNGRRIAHSLRYNTLEAAVAYFMIYVNQTHGIPESSITYTIIRHALRSQLKAML